MTVLKTLNAAGEELTILVVDDDAFVREVVVELLAEKDIAAREADSFQSALDVYAAGEFDAVILDNQLGSGTGIEFCRQLRKVDQKTPVFLFAGASDEVRLEALRAGVDEVLQKPDDLPRLAELVKRVVLRKRSAEGGPSEA